MTRLLLAIGALVGFLPCSAWSQSPPATCAVGMGHYEITTTTVAFSVCTAVNTWTRVNPSVSGGGLPSGAILLTLSAACPVGTAEVAALNGMTLIGTLAATGDVGTTGGSDTLTPAGSVSAPIFTGAPLATHLHAFGTLAVAAHTSVATKQGAAAGNVITTATHAVSGSTAAITAGTPAGTNAVPSFTGTPGENRSAFRRVMFCSAP